VLLLDVGPQIPVPVTTCLTLYDKFDVVPPTVSKTYRSRVNANTGQSTELMMMMMINCLYFRFSFYGQLLKQQYSNVASLSGTTVSVHYRAMLAQSAVMRLHVVCLSVRPSVRPSVTFRYRDHIRWNSSKIISRPNSLRSLLWLTPNVGDLVQREHPQN